MTMTRFKTAGFIATLFTAALLITCPAGATEYETRLKVALTAQPPTLDAPMTVSQAALDVAQNFFETLYTQDEHFKPTPMLAKSCEISDDRKTYTFRLREDVLFHNGKEMDADDVAASMNYWLQKSSRAKNLLGAANFEPRDKHTVVLTLPEPTGDVLSLMSTQANFPAIRPKASIEGATEKGVGDYTGTGPFIFKEWKQDQYIHLVRNPAYRALDTAPSGFSGRREPLVEEIYYYFVPDAATRLAGLLSGEYHIADDIPTENYKELKGVGNIVVHTDLGGTLTLFFNVREGVLADPRMRRAVNTALDMNDIMLASFADKDLFDLAPGYMNPDGIWASDAGKDRYNQHDPEAAKALFKEAGYANQELHLLTTPDYEEMYKATLVLQDQLRQAGINAVVDAFDFPTFMERKKNFKNWDLFITSNAYQLTPQQLLALNPDWAGADDPKLKEGVAAIRSAPTHEEAKKAWDALQGFLYDYLSSIALGQYKEITAVSDKVEGFVFWQAPILWNTKVRK